MEVVTTHATVVEIGGLPIEIQTADEAMARIVGERYRDFVRSDAEPKFRIRVQVESPNPTVDEGDAEVWLDGSEWRMRRGDFRARWNPTERQADIKQCLNPYSIDSVLRILHTLILAPEGGFLLHASSAVREGKAFLFSGVSEAGKTTIARLAPPDVELLTDEASYVRKKNPDYLAFGTPFAGDLGEPGKNVSAPIAALYLLAKSQKNRIEPLTPADAIQRILRNVLFFAREPKMVRQVFDAVCTFVATVPVYELAFFPDQRVWELIGNHDICGNVSLSRH